MRDSSQRATIPSRQGKGQAGDLSAGAALFLIPLIVFCKPENLKQLAGIDIIVISTSVAISTVVAASAAFLLNSALGRKFPERFPMTMMAFGIGYYSLFFFRDLKDGVVWLTTSMQTLVIMAIVWLGACIFLFFFERITLLLRRVAVIMLALNFIFVIASNYTDASSPAEDQMAVFDAEGAAPMDWVNQQPAANSRPPNVYFVVFDGMMSLAHAAEMEIISANDTRQSMANLGLDLFDKSISLYNVTYLSLASFFELGPTVTESSGRYKSRRDFFPNMMYSARGPVALPTLVERAGSEFIWYGNSWAQCREVLGQPWSCPHDGWMGYLYGPLNKFYQPTPLFRIGEILLGGSVDSGQRTLSLLSRRLQESETTSNPQFVFVHQLSPHDPFDVDETCAPSSFVSEYEGYLASYRCVLSEIETFARTIARMDPGAIVAFQSDHGWDFEDMARGAADKRAHTFSAALLPDRCRPVDSWAGSGVNVLRLVMNCAYGYDLQPVPDIHYLATYETDQSYGLIEVYRPDAAQ